MSSLVNRLRWGLRLVWSLPRWVKLIFRLVSDDRVSLAPKLLLLAALAYVVLPTDLVPDFFLGAGQLDDLAVILLGTRIFLRLCPPDIVREHVKAIASGK